MLSYTNRVGGSILANFPLFDCLVASVGSIKLRNDAGGTLVGRVVAAGGGGGVVTTGGGGGGTDKKSRNDIINYGTC